jgi:AraC-like DNA-binding protein
MRRSMELLRLGMLAGGAPYYAISSVLFGKHVWMRRDYVELFLIMGGEGVLNTLADDGSLRSDPLVPGQLIFLRPRDAYQTVGLGEQGMSCYIVALPVATWQSFAALIGLSGSWLTTPEPPQVVCDPADERVVIPFTRAIDRYRAGPTMFDLTEFLVAVWPVLLSASQIDPERADPPAWLRDAVEAMRLEANLRLGFPRFKELAHVSAAHLARTVRDFFGMTPTDLILEVRLHHAAVLLSTTTEDIGAIARRCGFSTASHFGMMFRRAATVSPREYRRRRLGGFVVAPVAGRGGPLPDSSPPRVLDLADLAERSRAAGFRLDEETVVIHRP